MQSSLRHAARVALQATARTAARPSTAITGAGWRGLSTGVRDAPPTPNEPPKVTLKGIPRACIHESLHDHEHDDDDCVEQPMRGRGRWQPYEDEADFFDNEMSGAPSHHHHHHHHPDKQLFDSPLDEPFKMRYQSLHGYNCDEPLEQYSAKDNDSPTDGPTDGSKADEPASSAADSSSSGDGSGAWTWAQPQSQRERRPALHEIPVRRGQLLSEAEVLEALEATGAIDVTVVPIQGKGGIDAEAMVFASGRSAGHMRRMADVFVTALKKRRLTQAPGVTGAEGYDCDDWMIVDCANYIVHFMDPRTRKALDLETHWTGDNYKKLHMPATGSEAEYERVFDQIVEAHPMPDDYEPLIDDEGQREKEMRRVLGLGGKGRTKRRGKRA